jgi:signal transduction histidine kinase
MTRRLVGTYLAITAFVLLVLIVPLGRTFASREQDNLLAGMERDATVVATLAEESLEETRPLALDTLLAGYAEDPGGRIVIVDANGVSVADSDNLDAAPRDFSTRPEIAAALTGQRDLGRRPSETLGTDLLYVAVPVGSSGKILGAVRITYPATTLNDAVRENWYRLGLLSVVVLVSVTIVGITLARQVTRPVRNLESAAESLASGDLGRRVPVARGVPELASLGRTFNDMADRIETLVASQRAFIADASHQLRTPLTALRLRLENLEDSATEADRGAVTAAITETNRLARLVDGLLAIARAEAQTESPEPVDLAAVATARGEAWRLLAQEGGVGLVVGTPASAWGRAVPGAMEQILDNLLSNALEASPAGTTITLSVAATGDGWELRVADQGPGMTDDERERAFDRFYSKGKPGRGSGLGLAIVRQLAVASGGEATLRATAGGGLEAVVSVPRSDAPAPAGRT